MVAPSPHSQHDSGTLNTLQRGTFLFKPPTRSDNPMPTKFRSSCMKSKCWMPLLFPNLTLTSLFQCPFGIVGRLLVHLKACIWFQTVTYYQILKFWKLLSGLNQVRPPKFLDVNFYRVEGQVVEFYQWSEGQYKSVFK